MRIHDEKRRNVPLRTRHLLSLPLPPEQHRELSKKRRRSLSITLYGIAILATAPKIVLAASLALSGASTPPPFDTHFFVSCVVFPIAVVGLHASATRRWASQMAAVLAARRRICGACAYDLRGSQAANDGFVTCPECGAAWRLQKNG
ncbi:MAG: hypothetical protein AAFR38_06675 [Planctomycetota bacterium]